MDRLQRQEQDDLSLWHPDTHGGLSSGMFRPYTALPLRLSPSQGKWERVWSSSRHAGRLPKHLEEHDHACGRSLWCTFVIPDTIHCLCRRMNDNSPNQTETPPCLLLTRYLEINFELFFFSVWTRVGTFLFVSARVFVSRCQWMKYAGGSNSASQSINYSASPISDNPSSAN